MRPKYVVVLIKNTNKQTENGSEHEHTARQ